jgi:High potential iron-sulfur protein
MTTRRQFITIVPVAGGALLAQQSVMAQANMVDEKDPQAVALGYVADAAKVDKTKYKQYAAGQTCANCALYQAKATDPTGGCPLFGAKKVAGKGWCQAWAKKA